MNLEYGQCFFEDDADRRFTVVGVVHGWIYRRLWPERDNTEWDRKFPGWDGKPVVCCFYQKPQPVMTFEEYLEQNPEMPGEVAQWNYDRIPRASALWVPFEAMEAKVGG